MLVACLRSLRPLATTTQATKTRVPSRSPCSGAGSTRRRGAASVASHDLWARATPPSATHDDGCFFTQTLAAAGRGRGLVYRVALRDARRGAPPVRVGRGSAQGALQRQVPAAGRQRPKTTAIRLSVRFACGFRLTVSRPRGCWPPIFGRSMVCNGKPQTPASSLFSSSGFLNSCG